MQPRRNSVLRTVARSCAALAIGTALLSVLGADRAFASPLGAAPSAPYRPLELDGPARRRFPLLDLFHEAAVERPGPVRTYLGGPWGRWRERPWMSLAMVGSPWELAPQPGLDASLERTLRLASVDDASSVDVQPVSNADGDLDALDDVGLEREIDEPRWSLGSLIAGLSASRGESLTDLLDPVARLLETLGRPASPTPLPPRGCWRRPVQFIRYGAETDRFALVRCDGSVAVEALDRLTLMARPPEVPRPGELLPDEPDPATWVDGEWLAGMRPAHPRLLWLLQSLADAYPRRAIYVYSGYRPRGVKKGHSLHGDARAMDISIHGVRNEDLFRFCRTLDDVGCGYYPNSKFVHVDVRRPGTGHAFWVDASHPGETSRYVDAWPGVVESGAMVWGAVDAGAPTASDAGAP